MAQQKVLLNVGEQGIVGCLFETVLPLSKLGVVVGFEERGARIAVD